MAPQKHFLGSSSANTEDEAETSQKRKASADGEEDASPTAKAGGAPRRPPGMPAVPAMKNQNPAGVKTAEVQAAAMDLVESEDVPWVTKRTYCAMFQLGTCRRNTLCGYAHSRAEMGEKVLDPTKIKVEMCRYWTSDAVNGCTMSSDECAFAHGQHELGRKRCKKGKVGKKGEGGKGKGKASGKGNHMRTCAARSDDSRSDNCHARRDDTRSPSKKQRARITLRGRSNMRGSHARRDDSRSPPVLPIKPNRVRPGPPMPHPPGAAPSQNQAGPVRPGAGPAWFKMLLAWAS